MSDTEEVAKLKARIAELEEDLTEHDDVLLREGYDQALQDLQEVTDGAMEVTRARGPAEGLTYLLARLGEKDVTTTPPRTLPHDWLSRWLVTDRVVV